MGEGFIVRKGGGEPTPIYITATGGTILNFAQNGKNYRAHIFTSNGTFEITELGNGERNKVDYLIVGGGGGGGERQGGGGGAGGYLEGTVFGEIKTYSITVGAGGVGALSSSQATNGVLSNIDLLTSGGGGRGGGNRDSGVEFRRGNDGGSGGGASQSGFSGGLAIFGLQGNKGADCNNDTVGGGGGGAGAAGTNFTTTPGNGKITIIVLNDAGFGQIDNGNDMGHYAKVTNGIVIAVNVASQEWVDKQPDKWAWVQTSYNMRGGVYYDPATNQPAADQSVIELEAGRKRKNYAGIGYRYDSERDAFIPPNTVPKLETQRGDMSMGSTDTLPKR
jgi:hypothetical protein